MWCPSYCCRSQSGHQSPLANCSTHTLPPLLPCTLCSAFSQPHGAHCAVSWGPSGWGPAGIQLMETTDRESWHIPDLYRCGVEVWVRHACNQSTSDSRLRHSLPHLPLLLLSSHFYLFIFFQNMPSYSHFSPPVVVSTPLTISHVVLEVSRESMHPCGELLRILVWLKRKRGNTHTHPLV